MTIDKPQGAHDHEVVKMFCSNCGTELAEQNKFCPNCGKDTHQFDNVTKSVGQFGRIGVKSFIEYKNSIGKPCKATLKKGKIQGKVSNKDEKEVVIKIGLMHWDANDGKLKERRAKRVALRVSTSSDYETLLENAKERWKHFWKNLYQEGKEYALLLEDGQIAMFLPGSNQEAFNLKRYKEEVMKDYKRITFYLCTIEDMSCNEIFCSDDEDVSIAVDKKRELPNIFDESADEDAGPSGCSTWVPSTRARVSEKENQICLSDSDSDDVGNAAVKRQRKDEHDDIPRCEEDKLQIKNDEEIAIALQSELDKEETLFTKECQVILALEEKVISNGRDSLYIVVRRKAQLQRKLKLWQRATNKVSPEHVLRVKFIGEDGIDTGALAKEFLTETISDINNKFFPDGSPIHSTNDIHNGNFRSCGELVAVSLAQGGPPPCFLDDKVYKTLVTDEDIDFTNPNLVEQLTSKEKEMLDQIKSDVMKFEDTIIGHGYTRQINQANVDSIISSVVVSIISKRMLCLNEFRRGLNLYGLADIVCNYSQVTYSLFVCGQQKVVDADYVLSLLKPEFSDEGSSRRVTEEHMMDYFQDFLMGLEDEKVNGDSEALAWAAGDNNEKTVEHASNADENDDENDDENESKSFSTQDISPGGVLGWLTAVKHRELGSCNQSIHVSFDHDCKNRNPHHTICFPVVGACGRAITLPVLHMNSTESFKHVFVLAISKSQAFGKR